MHGKRCPPTEVKPEPAGGSCLSRVSRDLGRPRDQQPAVRFRVLLKLAPLLVRANQISRLFRPTESTALSDIVDFTHTASFRLGSVRHDAPPAPGMPPFVSKKIPKPVLKERPSTKRRAGRTGSPGGDWLIAFMVCRQPNNFAIFFSCWKSCRQWPRIPVVKGT
jgi:hypothetical protein